MKAFSKIDNWLITLVVCMFSCSTADVVLPPDDTGNPDQEEEPNDQPSEAIIDLNNWKVTLPIGDPTEVEPPEILEYATNEVVKPFMYNDLSDSSLVFYTYPETSTANSSYSRTELREQMVPGSNSTNWTFLQGGNMRGTLKMEEISKDEDDKYHRTIIMQIHGRLTDEQRDLIGEDDNNAPPVLKIYWNNNRVRVLRKVLKNLDVSYEESLKTSAWEDEGQWFEEYVNFDKFTLEVTASEGRLQVTLNDDETMIFDDVHMERWGIFDNYFKAGNYLISTEEGAYARVKYYSLKVTH